MSRGRSDAKLSGLFLCRRFLWWWRYNRVHRKKGRTQRSTREHTKIITSKLPWDNNNAGATNHMINSYYVYENDIAERCLLGVSLDLDLLRERCAVCTSRRSSRGKVLAVCAARTSPFSCKVCRFACCVLVSCARELILRSNSGKEETYLPLIRKNSRVRISNVHSSTVVTCFRKQHGALFRPCDVSDLFRHDVTQRIENHRRSNCRRAGRYRDLWYSPLANTPLKRILRQQ